MRLTRNSYRRETGPVPDLSAISSIAGESGEEAALMVQDRSAFALYMTDASREVKETGADKDGKMLTMGETSPGDGTLTEADAPGASTPAVSDEEKALAALADATGGGNAEALNKAAGLGVQDSVPPHIFYALRLSTFPKRWALGKKFLCQPDTLAEAGFVYVGSRASPDAVRCWVCQKELEGFEEKDEPWDEHLSHSKECPFALMHKTEDQITVKELLRCLAYRSRKLQRVKLVEYREALVAEATAVEALISNNTPTDNTLSKDNPSSTTRPLRARN